MESKKHFKLYKSGKKWCCMALTTAAAVIGVAVAHQTVQADVTSTSTSDVQQAVVNNNADATNANEVTADSRNFSDVSANINNEATDNKTVTESNNNQTSNSLESVKTTEKSITTNYNVNINDQYGNESTYSSTEKNGWVQENGQEVYYQNGKTTAGQDYIYVESMDNPSTKNWYMVKDGVAQSGLQKWYGTYYYFNPTTYLKETNAYINVKWANGDVTPYMFDNTGAIVQGLYQQNGTYYYYNPSTYLRETNTYQQVTWANGKTTWYMFGNDGRIVTGLYKWYGKYYYFNPSTYEKETNAYIPVTWANEKTTWYMFDNTGSIVTGLYKWYGKYYYFDPSTYEKDINMDVEVNGVKYHLDNTGAATVVNNAASKADRALTVIGTPYVWGGNKPGGFDCSGLVQWAFGLGANYRTTYQQTNLGTHHRNVYSAPKGSLVFFGSDSAPYHVGISLGNGTFVHAPEPGDKVKVTKMAYYTPSFYIVMN